MKYIDDKELISKMNNLNLPPDQQSVVDEAIRLLGHRQAHIDMLMGEWEPDEMSKEQFDNWASRQQPAPEESLQPALRLTATKEERQAWFRPNPLTAEQETALAVEAEKFANQMSIIKASLDNPEVDYQEISRTLRNAIVENEMAKSAIKNGE